jgi:hypothetical protein
MKSVIEHHRETLNNCRNEPGRNPSVSPSMVACTFLADRSLASAMFWPLSEV